jgi:hypothetical protein
VASLEERLAAHRARFAVDLAGRWSTAQGSFDVVQGERWDFHEDGRLVVTDAHGVVDEVRWEVVGPFRVRLGLPEDDGTTTWTTLDYEFVVACSDVGEEVVLREVGREGFWTSLAPLRRVGD